jgi:hypothetical protein
MTTTNLYAALNNASNDANAAYLSKDRQQIVNAYMQLLKVANLATQNNHYFLGQEAFDMADDLSYHF